MSEATLVIRTGLQGHGKTLNTIKEVDAQAYKESRAVYYNNVTGLDPSKLQADWFEFEDPHLWYELPKDSIIVVDEAQEFFGVRDPRKDIPRYCSRFETMRKQGHEVHLITQDPRFIDVHVRRLCGTHVHYSRIFGSSQLARYQTQRVFNEVEKFSVNKEADRTIIKIDKKFFDVYSSAQANHHFKFKPSKKMMFFAVATLVTLFLVYRVYDTVYRKASDSQEPTSSVVDTVKQTVDSTSSSIFGLAKSSNSDKPVTPEQFMARQQPRIDTIPASAPIYDELTEPKSFPRLNCVHSSDPSFIAKGQHETGIYNGSEFSCTCYTQQGSRMNAGFQFCMSASTYGYFDNTRPDRQPEGDFQSPQPNLSNPLYTPDHSPQSQPDTYIGFNNGNRVISP